MGRKWLSALLALMLIVGCVPTWAEEMKTELPGLVWESRMDLKYATCFSVDYYEGGYALVDVKEDARYLVVPEGAAVPEELDANVVILRQPVQNVYLATSAAMALFDALDAVDAIRMSGFETSGWYIENAAAAMERGEMLFAGKYSEPDYELLVDEDCGLAIENTMIYRKSNVKEMLESLGIPVFVDRSSYEPHPLGRTEWIKLYAVMLDKEELAAAFFDEQAQVIEQLKDFENTGKTVALFYINSDGSVNVRAPGDYIAKMVELAGGRYAFSELDAPEGNRATISLTMEDFYALAVDADYMIYNAAVDGNLNGVDDIIAKNGLIADFKAVREGNVWCTGNDLYQATDTAGQLITDINQMLTGQDAPMTFLRKLS